MITGAGSGIGRATALLLGRNGAKLHLADIDGARAEAVAGEVRAAGGEASAHTLDVSDAQAVDALAETVFAAEGGVDVLHNNAGIGHGANIEATTFEDWERVITREPPGRRLRRAGVRAADAAPGQARRRSSTRRRGPGSWRSRRWRPTAPRSSGSSG